MDPLRPGSAPIPSARLTPRADARSEETEQSLDGFTLGTRAVRPGHPGPESFAGCELIHPGTALEFRPPLDEALGRLPPRLVQTIAQEGYRLHVVDSTGQHPLTLELEGGSEHSWRGQGISAAAWELVTWPQRSNVAGMVYNGPVPGLRGEGLRLVLWDKVFRRGDGLADWYILHEMGHCTDYTFAFRWPERWRGWAARVEAAFQDCSDHLTRYARESPIEYLAEGFAAWATPAGLERHGEPAAGMEQERWGLDREVLAVADPRLLGLIEEAVAALA